MARARQRIRELTARLIGTPVASIIGRLNRFLAGWAGYFRHGNSARSFDKLHAHAKTRIAIFLGIKHNEDDGGANGSCTHTPPSSASTNSSAP